MRTVRCVRCELCWTVWPAQSRSPLPGAAGANAKVQQQLQTVSNIMRKQAERARSLKEHGLGEEKEWSSTKCSLNSFYPWSLRASFSKSGRSQYLHPAVSLSHTAPPAAAALEMLITCSCPFCSSQPLVLPLQNWIVLNAIEAWNCLRAIWQEKQSVQKCVCGLTGVFLG